MLPTSTNVTVEFKPKPPVAVDAVAIFVTEGAADAGPAAELLSEVEQAGVKRLLAAGVSRGKGREVHFDLLDGAAGGKARRIIVVGLGKVDQLSAEAVRQSAGALARSTKKMRLGAVSVVLPNLPAGAAAAGEAVATGLLLAAFDYEEYKGTVSQQKKAEDASPGKRVFTILSNEADRTAAAEGVRRGVIIAEAQNFARTIATRPGNDINPPSLAKVAQQLAKEVGLVAKVLDEKQMEKMRMGGIMGVGKGSSATPPRMIVLEWNPSTGPRTGGKGGAKGKAAKTAPLLVIGKAITFDTGGISIKPADKMGKMIFDKCGGMAVLGLMAAVARLKLPIPVIGILASAENHISETAYRPGDILRMYNGVTVEVTNTDAEGRLVLGDALAWGIETYQPSAVVDLATLTGGVVVALGKSMAGVMSNSDELVKELTDAGEQAGEKMWRLPLFDEHRDYIRSDFADIVNSGGREGHPLQGGAFLSFFVPADNSIPWAHLDIAGTADTEKELPYYAKGATGWGVRTLLEWVQSRIQPATNHASPRAAGG